MRFYSAQNSTFKDYTENNLLHLKNVHSIHKHYSHDNIKVEKNNNNNDYYYNIIKKNNQNENINNEIFGSHCSNEAHTYMVNDNCHQPLSAQKSCQKLYYIINGNIRGIEQKNISKEKLLILLLFFCNLGLFSNQLVSFACFVFRGAFVGKDYSKNYNRILIEHTGYNRNNKNNENKNKNNKIIFNIDENNINNDRNKKNYKKKNNFSDKDNINNNKNKRNNNDDNDSDNNKNNYNTNIVNINNKNLVFGKSVNNEEEINKSPPKFHIKHVCEISNENIRNEIPLIKLLKVHRTFKKKPRISQATVLDTDQKIFNLFFIFSFLLSLLIYILISEFVSLMIMHAAKNSHLPCYHWLDAHGRLVKDFYFSLTHLYSDFSSVQLLLHTPIFRSFSF